MIDLSLNTGYREWMERGACRRHPQPDLWHSDKQDETAQAKEICRTECPVALACLRHALAENEREGVWGATTPKERAKLAKGERPKRKVRGLSEDCALRHPTEPCEPFQSGKRIRCRARKRADERNRDWSKAPWSTAACEMNHPGDEPEVTTRETGRQWCRACNRVYNRRRRSQAA